MPKQSHKHPWNKQSRCLICQRNLVDYEHSEKICNKRRNNKHQNRYKYNKQLPSWMYS